MPKWSGRGERIRAKRQYYCRQCAMQWAAIPPEKTPNAKGKMTVSKESKEKAKRCPSCGAGDPIFFASSREAMHYRQLLQAQAAGLISDLELQPEFPLVPGVKYVADFAYTDSAGQRVFEDSKGMETEVFKLKMKLLSHFYPDVTICLK
jgi:hypothetical protein